MGVYSIKHFVNGQILNKNLAVCSNRQNVYFSHVRVGEYRVGEDQVCLSDGKGCLPPVQNIDVEDVKIHEEWNAAKFALGNDIALIRLKTPVKLLIVSFKLGAFLV